MNAWFVFSDKPWFARGADYGHGTDAGVFAFARNNGRVTIWLSFRRDVLCQNKENVN